MGMILIWENPNKMCITSWSSKRISASLRFLWTHLSLRLSEIVRAANILAWIFLKVVCMWGSELTVPLWVCLRWLLLADLLNDFSISFLCSQNILWHILMLKQQQSQIQSFTLYSINHVVTNYILNLFYYYSHYSYQSLLLFVAVIYESFIFFWYELKHFEHSQNSYLQFFQPSTKIQHYPNVAFDILLLNILNFFFFFWHFSFYILATDPVICNQLNDNQAVIFVPFCMPLSFYCLNYLITLQAMSIAPYLSFCNL